MMRDSISLIKTFLVFFVNKSATLCKRREIDLYMHLFHDYANIIFCHQSQVSPREEPSRDGASDDHVLAAQVELARHEEQEQIIPPGRLKSIALVSGTSLNDWEGEA